MNTYENDSLSLLVPNLNGNDLIYISLETGKLYKPNDEQTLLTSGGSEHPDIFSKFKNTITYTAQDPINPKIKLDNGCPNCSTKVVSYQRLGEYKTNIYQCLCGTTW